MSKDHIHTTVLLAGHLNSKAFTAHPDQDPFWHPSLIFSQTDQFYGQAVDRSGNVSAFLPLDMSDPRNFTRIAYATVQSLGQPRLVGFVPDPAKPNEVAIMNWLEMAQFGFDNYDQIRARVKANPVSGYAFAGFMTGEVPQYLKNSGQQLRENLDHYDLELADLRAIAAKHLRTSPALKELSRDKGDMPDIRP